MSVAVSCAAELLQAVLLNTGPSGQIPVPLVQCLRGFSRDQVEEASKFLHDQGIMVRPPSLARGSTPECCASLAWVSPVSCRGIRSHRKAC